MSDKIDFKLKHGKIETIEDFYKRKFDWIPDNIKKDVGQVGKILLTRWLKWTCPTPESVEV